MKVADEVKVTIQVQEITLDYLGEPSVRTRAFIVKREAGGSLGHWFLRR